MIRLNQCAEFPENINSTFNNNRITTVIVFSRTVLFKQGIGDRSILQKIFSLHEIGYQPRPNKYKSI